MRSTPLVHFARSAATLTAAGQWAGDDDKEDEAGDGDKGGPGKADDPDDAALEAALAGQPGGGPQQVDLGAGKPSGEAEMADA